ncbi:MAG: hypothetical protein AAB065_08505 [Deltaproteobacteria bacterium]
MNKENLSDLINELGKHGGNQYNPIKHMLARRKLINYGRKNINDLLSVLDCSDQESMTDVIEILGKIGNKEAIPRIKKCIGIQALWGKTILNIGIALIRLGDDEGIAYLKEQIKDTSAHRDLRIDAANALIKLKKKGVFGRDEHVDATGASMTDAWLNKLLKLVDSLRSESSGAGSSG